MHTETQTTKNMGFFDSTESWWYILQCWKLKEGN